jgi:hypothetical protein
VTFFRGACIRPKLPRGKPLLRVPFRDRRYSGLEVSRVLGLSENRVTISRTQALEQEISSLKKVSDQRTEKYFSEKKNWQAKIRELESKVVSVEVKSSSGAAKSIPSLSSISDPSSDRNLAQIEEQIMSKSVKIKELNTKINLLEQSLS